MDWLERQTSRWLCIAIEIACVELVWLFINCSELIKNYNLERTELVLFFSGHRGFLCHVPSEPPSAKRTGGESGNQAEVAASCGEYPKARTKLTRSGPVSDEGFASDTELQFRNRSNKWGMIRIACCWPIIEKSPLVRWFFHLHFSLELILKLW